MAGEDGRVRDGDVRKRGALGLGMETGGRGTRWASEWRGRKRDALSLGMGNLDNPTYKNTMRRKLLNIMLLGACLASCGRQADSGVDYDLEPMPPVHSPLPEN